MDSNHTGAKSPAKKRGGRSARRRSREFALQGVYQWLMSHTDPEAIDAAALEAEDFDKADQAFYRELLHGVTEEFPSLEASYAPHIDREVTSLSPIERASAVPTALNMSTEFWTRWFPNFVPTRL